MEGWRCQGSRGALRAVTGATLLTLGLSMTVPRVHCRGVSSIPSLPQVEQEDLTWQDTSSGFMTPLVDSFLHTVQPNPFPHDLVLEPIQDSQSINQEWIKEVMLYEVGFLVCAIIGLLYIILMPIIGIFLACCRCCGNCGGKMQQKQTDSIPCRRRFLYWSTLVVTVIILAGNVCMFKSNDDLNAGVTQSPAHLNNTIHSVHTFISFVPQQVQSVVDERFTTLDTIASNLKNIGYQLGRNLQIRFTEFLYPVYRLLSLLNGETTSFGNQLKRLDSSLTQHVSSMDDLQRDITDVKSGITRTLSDPNCSGCDKIRPVIQPELDRLTLNPVTTPNISNIMLEVDQINQIDDSSVMMQAHKFVSTIPQKVMNMTRDEVREITQQLENMKTKFNNTVSMPDLTNVLEPVDQLFTDTIGKHGPTIQYVEAIRFKVCIALCCVVLLVVLCNFLGLVLGPLGLTPKTDPTMRSCTADTGGTFFMIGAGFSFLFSWVLMIAVLLLFLLGGNAHTIVCRPWSNGELLQFIDSAGVVQMLGLENNVSITHIYRDCAANKPMWKILRMHEMINLDELFDTSQYVADLQQQFGKLDFTLPPLTLLSPDMRDKLNSFSINTEELNSTTLTEQIDAMSSINLNTSADSLERLGSVTDVNTQAELRSHANDIRRIQATKIEQIIIPQLKKLNSTVTTTLSMAENLEGTVGEVRRGFFATQDIIDANSTQIVQTEIGRFWNCQLGHINFYTSWAKRMVREEVGRCKPVAEAVDSLELIFCSHMVGSLNAFWFSLGWCVVFFIPSIIFSIKLAKYYRKMTFSE